MAFEVALAALSWASAGTGLSQPRERKTEPSLSSGEQACPGARFTFLASSSGDALSPVPGPPSWTGFPLSQGHVTVAHHEAVTVGDRMENMGTGFSSV